MKTVIITGFWLAFLVGCQAQPTVTKPTSIIANPEASGLWHTNVEIYNPPSTRLPAN
jgi:hypothetical protein